MSVIRPVSVMKIATPQLLLPILSIVRWQIYYTCTQKISVKNDSLMSSNILLMIYPMGVIKLVPNEVLAAI
jgi:hypothetical protein